MVKDQRAAEEKHAGEVKDLSAKLAAAGAENLALQRGFEARLETLKGELSTAQDTVKSTHESGDNEIIFHACLVAVIM